MNSKDIENKWQKKWAESKAFEPKINLNQEKFFSTVPYPYANSAMHIGHGRAYTTADIYTRFQRLIGKNVLFPLGYHISGTPVLAVADGIKRGDEKQIAVTRDAISDSVPNKEEQDKLIESFSEPMNIANFFIGTIQNSLSSVGISIDWSREFSTGDEVYQKFIEWQFGKLKEAGILVQGKYPILYSPEDENAVGEDDIKDGDIDKVQVQEMSYILFKLKDSEEHIAVATLRPDALFGTTNIWMSENIPLVKIEINNQSWIIAKEAVTKLKHQYDNVKIIEDVDPKTLIGTFAITPLTNREVIIASANFIDARHGTGIVYSSPAGAPHDWMALKEAKEEGRVPKDVEVLVTVDTFDKNKQKVHYSGSCPAEDKINKYGAKSSNDEEALNNAKQELYKEEHYGGKLNSLCGEFEGLPIKFAKDKVHEKLVEKKLGGTLYETSRRAQTRSGNDVIVANLEGQWFLDYSKPETKEKAFALLEKMTYNPSKMKATQKGYLDWVQMRPCARKRGIGTPLPYDKEWVIESLSDSTIYQMFYLTAKVINEQKIPAKDLTPEVFDYVFLGKGDKNALPLDDDLLIAMEEQVAYWKSFDFRYTAGAHLSNHLSFLIYHYALIFSEEYHPKNITIGGMLIKDGHKISKSKGNGVPLIRVKEKYGADLYRLYIAVGANYDIEMDFKDEEIEQLEKKFNRFKELLFAAVEKELPQYESFNGTNKWLISRYYSYVENYFEMFDTLRMREAYVGVLYEFMNDVSYHERRTSYEETIKVLRFIAKDYIQIMTPAIPHVCEELYSKIGEEGFVSLAKFDTNIEDYIDEESMRVENIVQELVSNVARMKTQRKIEKLKSVTLVQAKNSRFDLFDTLNKLLAETKDVKKIFGELKKDFSDDFKFIQKFVPKTLGSGLDHYLSKSEEKEFLSTLIPFLEKEFGCSVTIIDNEEKAGNAIPSKPTALVE